jgi:hypothetical protein
MARKCQSLHWSCFSWSFTCPMPPAAPATTALTILLSLLGRGAVMRGRGSSELFELLNAGEMERSVQLIYQSWSGDTREK